MKTARCSASTDPRHRGVTICITQFDNQVATGSIYVTYTPALARQVAHDILVEADKADALGGPTKELEAVCGPGNNRNVSAS